MIKKLRESRGMTQGEFAMRLNMSQPAVSKLEKDARLDEKLLRSISKILEAEGHEEYQLLFHFALTSRPNDSYQVIVTHGANRKQREIARIESAARQIDQYEPTIIPGLLQVPSYMRGVMREFDVRERDMSEAVNLRISRQQILANSERRFHFILSETSLRTAPAGDEAQAEQLETLLIHAGRRNTRIGVIPAKSGTVPSAMTGFVIFDSSYATAETTVSEQQIRDPTDLQHLVELHRRLADKAVYGADATILIRGAICDFEGGQETAFHE
jgi:transcriptional regulator with XRE-family HTH domain